MAETKTDELELVEGETEVVDAAEVAEVTDEQTQQLDEAGGQVAAELTTFMQQLRGDVDQKEEEGQGAKVEKMAA